jgi:ATP synthase I subunit
VTWLIAVIGGVAAIVLSVSKGWRFGSGFLLGAGLSYLSFWRWRKLVDSIGTSGPRNITQMLLRFVLLIAAAYAIIEILALSPAPVLLGLLVPGAAVTVSLVIELSYARK